MPVILAFCCCETQERIHQILAYGKRLVSAHLLHHVLPKTLGLEILSALCVLLVTVPYLGTSLSSRDIHLLLMFWAQRTCGTEMGLLHPCPLKGSDSTRLVDLLDFLLAPGRRDVARTAFVWTSLSTFPRHLSWEPRSFRPHWLWNQFCCCRTALLNALHRSPLFDWWSHTSEQSSKCDAVQNFEFDKLLRSESPESAWDLRGGMAFERWRTVVLFCLWRNQGPEKWRDLLRITQLLTAESRLNPHFSSQFWVSHKTVVSSWKYVIHLSLILG